MRISRLNEALQLSLDELSGRAGAGAAIDVAVIDSGVDMTHPDLTGRVVRSVRIENGETTEVELGTNNDTYGHGTAVAGIICRIAPNARIHDIRVLHPGNAGSGEDLIEGLRLALRERIRVINMSLSSPVRFVPKLAELCERAFYQNQIIVAAKRNTPITDEGYPAEFSTCLGVDTTPFPDPLLLRYNMGKVIELEANGEQVVAPRVGGGYTTHTGTSFATPAIAGMCALLVGVFPELRPFEVRTLLSFYGRGAPSDTRPAQHWVERVRKARGRGDFFGAFDEAKRGLVENPDSLRLQYEAVRALADARAFENADRRLAMVEKSGRIDGLDEDEFQLWEDLVCLRGRLWKESAFTGGGDAIDRFRKSAECYEQAFRRSQEYLPSRTAAHFPAINAATMWHCAGEKERAAELAAKALDFARRDGPHYWTSATIGEASILLGDKEGATEALREARRLVDGKWDQLASTRRQLRRLLPTTSVSPEILNTALAAPGILCLLPNPLGPDSLLDGSPIGAEIGDEIDRNIEMIDAAVAFTTLLTPRDIWVAEAVIARKVELVLVLPCDAKQCCEAFVARYGADWEARYRSCIAGAARTIAVTGEGRLEEETLLRLCGKQMIGMALLRGDALVGAPVYQLGLGQIPGDWVQAGVRLLEAGKSYQITLGRGAEPSDRVARALLFGDVRGFSKLNEHELKLFLDGVIGGFADVLKEFDNVVEYTETAGDGIYVVINDMAAAAECCLKLQTVLRPEYVKELGLPDHLALRLGAHVGPVTPAIDELIKRRKFIGTEVTRTARIEPATPEGKIYVTEQFAAMLYHADQRFHCAYVGIQQMAKGYGECRMYSLERAER